MNSKRWIAVGLSLVVFFSSLVISFVGKILTQDVDTRSFWEEFMSDAISETIVREGSFDERIAVFNVRGMIMNMEESYFSVPQYNHQRILESLDTVKNDDTIKGIILRIDSPGGGVYESAELSDKIREVKKVRDIPIYVVMESMAASGGYYIAAYADQIYASNETITGSIGVIMSGMNFAGLMDKLGVEDMTIKSGEMKDVGSSTRELTDKDYEILQGLVDSMYERFVDVVSEGRGMEREDVYELADGRIYDGVQAQKNGLVDQIGYYEEALEEFETAYGLENAQIITYDQAELDIFGQLFMKTSKLKSFGQEINLGNIELPATWKEQSGFMYLYRGY
jgi:protease-4